MSYLFPTMPIICRLAGDSDITMYRGWFQAQKDGLLWQSPEWKKYQESIGRKTKLYLAFKDRSIVASALLIIDKGSFGLSTWDCPRGPVGNEEAIAALVSTIKHDAKHEHALAVFYSSVKEHGALMRLKKSVRTEQPKATLALDLIQSDDDILKQMHPKGRYNIKVSEKHSVTIQKSNDIDSFYELLKQTAKRDGFRLRPKSQYKAFLDLPGAFLLLAAHETSKKPIGGLLGLVWGQTGIYYYGASDEAFRGLMAPYLLQWHAIQYCRLHGALTYDFLGISPPDKPDNLIGVTEFKKKFGGTVVQYPPERVKILRPIAFHVLRLKRKFFG